MRNWLSLLNSPKTRRQLMQLLKNGKTRNNRGWTIFSMISLGTVLGTVITRNKNMLKPVQKYMRKTVNVMPAKMNFANAEFANEITPNAEQKQQKTENQNQQKTDNQNQQ